MKIGKLEVRWDNELDIGGPIDGVDRTSVFAVPSNEPWWLAVHQIVNEIELEAFNAARSRVANTNECINSIGASEGAMMVRLRLVEKRENALRVGKENR
jgi:hypothetical protein